MKNWNAFWSLCMIAVPLAGLFGCGGGSTTNNSDTTPIDAVSPVHKVPDAPTGVSVVGGTNKATLSWNAANGATSYNIYWSTAPEVTTTTGTRIASAGTSYIQRGMLPAVTYHYIVTAQNSSGESSPSVQASAVTALTDGSIPYTTFCAGCHGKLATSSVTDTSETEIRAAMRNMSAMYSLSLTDSQIAAISAALMYNN